MLRKEYCSRKEKSSSFKTPPPEKGNIAKKKKVDHYPRPIGGKGKMSSSRKGGHMVAGGLPAPTKKDGRKQGDGAINE